MLAIQTFKKGRRDSYRWRNAGKNGYRVGTAYVDSGRPFVSGGTIIEDLIWRRTAACVAPVKRKIVENIIRGYLRSYGMELTAAFYSRRAGCNCGCSPGYILYAKPIYTWQRLHSDYEPNAKYGTKFHFSVQYDEFRVFLAPVDNIYRDRLAVEIKKSIDENKKKEAIIGAGI